MASTTSTLFSAIVTQKDTAQLPIVVYHHCSLQFSKIIAADCEAQARENMWKKTDIDIDYFTATPPAVQEKSSRGQ